MANQEKLEEASKRILGINDLWHVYDACRDCAVKWNPIGLQLLLSPDQLEEIAAITNTPCDRLQKVLEAWLRKNTISGSSDPSYYTLCHAVAKGGENPALAERIAAEHPDELTHDDHEDRNIVSSGSGECYTDDDLKNLCSCGECSLLNIISNGCPVTKEEAASRFQLLDIKRLSKEKKEQYHCMIFKETQNIREAFDALCDGICESLQSRGIPVDRLKAHVKRTGWFKHAKDRSAQLDELKRCQDINSVFSLLADVCSWFNHDPLNSLVKKWGNDKDRENYNHFVNKTLKDFLQQSISQIPKDSLASVIEGSGQFQLKMDADEVYENIKAEYLVSVKGAVAEALDLSIENLHILSFEEGCINTTFMVPHSIYKELFPLSVKHTQALEAIVIPINEHESSRVKSIQWCDERHGSQEKILLSFDHAFSGSVLPKQEMYSEPMSQDVEPMHESMSQDIEPMSQEPQQTSQKLSRKLKLMSQDFEPMSESMSQDIEPMSLEFLMSEPSQPSEEPKQTSQKLKPMSRKLKQRSGKLQPMREPISDLMSQDVEPMSLELPTSELMSLEHSRKLKPMSQKLQPISEDFEHMSQEIKLMHSKSQDKSEDVVQKKEESASPLSVATTKVLELYKKITGVNFKGTYKEKRGMRYSGGFTHDRHLVEVDVSSLDVTSVMDEITRVDIYDQVWKGITHHTFWAEKVLGSPKVGDTCTFVILKVEPLPDLKWQRRQYDAVINVTLKVQQDK